MRKWLNYCIQHKLEKRVLEQNWTTKVLPHWHEWSVTMICFIPIEVSNNLRQTHTPIYFLVRQICIYKSVLSPLYCWSNNLYITKIRLFVTIIITSFVTLNIFCNYFNGNQKNGTLVWLLSAGKNFFYSMYYNQ